MDQDGWQVQQEYQRRLAAWQDARAEADRVAASRRRLAYDRGRLDAGQAQDLDAALVAAQEALSERVRLLRDEAEAQRDILRRLNRDGAEPDQVPGDGRGVDDRWEQPPFQEPTP